MQLTAAPANHLYTTILSYLNNLNHSNFLGTVSFKSANV
jgi:hypothetical protein